MFIFVFIITCTTVETRSSRLTHLSFLHTFLVVTGNFQHIALDIIGAYPHRLIDIFDSFLFLEGITIRFRFFLFIGSSEMIILGTWGNKCGFQVFRVFIERTNIILRVFDKSVVAGTGRYKVLFFFKSFLFSNCILPLKLSFMIKGKLNFIIKEKLNFIKKEKLLRNLHHKGILPCSGFHSRWVRGDFSIHLSIIRNLGLAKQGEIGA